MHPEPVNIAMPEPEETTSMKNRWVHFIRDLQDDICRSLEAEDGKAVFISDKWQRPDGGGGDTRVIANGNVFEKGGVNTSVVYGDVTDTMRTQLKIEGSKCFACGLSLVIHPLNPYVPTVHANWRYFELYNEQGDIIDRWFGGGADLTPYYLFEDDARHFHQTLKEAIDPFGNELYYRYKKNCDEYFSNAHRNNEMRGIGGVFYDYLRATNQEEVENFLFRNQAAMLFEAYLPIVIKRW
jgi:coproporphyrinogen III oxidase